MRLPTTKLTLPNDFEKLKFPVNRIADNAEFNSKIAMVDENFKKLLEYGTIVDNNLPMEYENIFDLNSKLFLSKMDSGSLHNYKHIEATKRIDGKVIVICATKTQIDFYSSDIDGSEDLTLEKSYTQVKDKGNLIFKSISYIKYNDSRLYVYDSIYQAIFVYDINTFINADTATFDIKFLKQFFKIESLIAFDFGSNSIFGLKDHNIILYNRDFNVKLISPLSVPDPIDIQVYGDKIYVAYDNKVIVYDLNLKKISEINYTKPLNGITIRIVFSKVDSGVFYILTDVVIYKYLTDGTFVGYFKESVGDQFLDFVVYDNTSNDLILGMDTRKLHIFKDKIIEYKLYDEVNLIDVTSLEQLKINNLELEQDFVYNTIIKQMIFNTFLLYNSIIYRAFIETDENGVLLYNYLENIQNSVKLDRDLIYYGQNEVFSYQTFNRVFREIYNIQLNILDLFKFNIVVSSTNTLLI